MNDKTKGIAELLNNGLNSEEEKFSSRQESVFSRHTTRHYFS